MPNAILLYVSESVCFFLFQIGPRTTTKKNTEIRPKSNFFCWKNELKIKVPIQKKISLLSVVAFAYFKWLLVVLFCFVDADDVLFFDCIIMFLVMLLLLLLMSMSLFKNCSN